MKNFRKRLDRIMACTKIGVEEITEEVLNKLETMNPKELFKISFLEFLIVENKICVYTIKNDPYLYQELQSFELLSNDNASTVFQKLSDKLKKDGCKLEDFSETCFKVATKPFSPIK